MRREVIRVLTFVLLSPGSLVAQEISGGDARGTIRVGGVEIHEGSRIRLAAKGLDWSGRAAPYGPDSILVGVADLYRPLAIHDIDSLWVGHRSAGKGAKIGAISLGLAGGITLGLAIGGVVGALCETDDCEGVRAGILGGVITGAGSAIVGAGLGAAIGSAVTRWELVYPSSAVR